MGLHEETLDGGLVTSKSVSRLEKGQLPQANNAVYRKNSGALWQWPGQAVFGAIPTVSGTAQSVNGLRDIRFDNGDHYLVAHTDGGAYFTAPIGATGTFTSREVVASGENLHAVHFQNKFFLFNGVQNRTWYLSATAAGTAPSIRVHGLLPVTASLGTATATGTWSLSATGYFEYWATEVAQYTKDGAIEEIESTYVGNPSTVYVSSTSMRVVLSLPDAVNPTSTRFRIYRSPLKLTAADIMFPVGFKIGEVDVGVSSTFTDGVATSTTGILPTAVAELNDWTDATNIFTNNGSSASATFFGLGDKYLSLKTFGMAPTEPIVGLRVSCECKQTGLSTMRLLVSMSWDGGTNWTAEKTIVPTTSGTEAVAVVGDADSSGRGFDLWGRTAWTAAELNDTNFRLRLRAFSTGTGSITSDVVSVSVYSAGVDDAIETDAFPGIVLEIGGVETAIGSHGTPPVASTGVLFNDTLVLNDTSNPSLVRWSLAGQPEYFPSLYFIDFETETNDRVTYIGAVGDRVIVGCENSIWRVNYLPTDANATFDRSKAIEPLSKEIGIVGPDAACLFNSPGGRQILGFVSSVGVHMTDGFLILDMLPGVDYGRLRGSSTAKSNIHLINDPRLYELHFMFNNTALSGSPLALENDLHISYHFTHQIAGSGQMSLPKPIGPINKRIDTERPRSAWSVIANDGTSYVYTGYDKQGSGTYVSSVSVEGDTITPTDTNDMAVLTRRLYLGEKGGEWESDKVTLENSDTTGASSLTVTPITIKDSAAPSTGTAKTFTFVTGQEMCEREVRAGGAGISYLITRVSGNPKLEAAIIEGAKFGEQDG